MLAVIIGNVAHGGRPAALYIGVGLAGVATIGGFRLPHSHPIMSHAENADASQSTPSVGRILTATGITLSFAWGLFQFLYVNEFNAIQAGAALNIEAEIEEFSAPQASSGLRTFVVDVTLQNVSDTKVQVVSSLYSAALSRTNAHASIDREFYDEAIADGDDGQGPTENPSASRYSNSSSRQVIEFGRVTEEGWYFEPNETFATQIVVEVPDDRSFNHLSLSMDLWVARGDRLTLDLDGHDDLQFVTDPDSHSFAARYVVKQWRIEPLTGLREIMREAEVLKVVTFLEPRPGVPGSDTYPFTDACIDADRVEGEAAMDPSAICPSPRTELQTHLQEFFGLVRTGVVFESPIAPFTATRVTETPSS
jgi:hypothetical protein